MPRRHVIYHEEYGVLLAVEKGSAFFANVCPKGIQTAEVFRNDTAARLFLSQHLPQMPDAVVREVKCKAKECATRDECVAAGLKPWPITSAEYLEAANQVAQELYDAVNAGHTPNVKALDYAAMLKHWSKQLDTKEPDEPSPTT